MLAFYTKRLEMYELSVRDLADLHQLHSLAETDRYNTLGIPESIETTEQLLVGLIDKRSEGVFTGMACPDPVLDFGHIFSRPGNVLLVFDELILQELFQVSPRVAQLG